MIRRRISAILLKSLYRLGWFSHTIRLISSDLYGKKWIIPIIDKMGFGTAFGIETEQWIFKFLKEFHSAKPIDAFIDIGVNTGQTLLKVKSLDPDIAYFGFEPNPTCVFYVEYLIQINKMKQAQLMCVALGNKESVLDLTYEGPEDTRATLVNIEGVFKKEIYSRKVPVFPLDAIGLPLIAKQRIVLKIDVEGYEYEVICGAEGAIKMFSPIILFEVLPHLEKAEAIEKQNRLFNFLAGHHYCIYRLAEGKEKERIEKGFDNASDYSKSDYIALIPS